LKNGSTGNSVGRVRGYSGRWFESISVRMKECIIKFIKKCEFFINTGEAIIFAPNQIYRVVIEFNDGTLVSKNDYTLIKFSWLGKDARAIPTESFRIIGYTLKTLL
jgi:hypothetical protein